METHKHPCPKEIKNLFVGCTFKKKLPKRATDSYFKWVKSLDLKRGDLIEVWGDGKENTTDWFWWEFQPAN